MKSDKLVDNINLLRYLNPGDKFIFSNSSISIEFIVEKGHGNNAYHLRCNGICSDSGCVFIFSNGDMYCILEYSKRCYYLRGDEFTITFVSNCHDPISHAHNFKL